MPYEKVNESESGDCLAVVENSLLSQASFPLILEKGFVFFFFVFFSPADEKSSYAESFDHASPETVKKK